MLWNIWRTRATFRTRRNLVELQTLVHTHCLPSHPPPINILLNLHISLFQIACAGCALNPFPVVRATNASKDTTTESISRLDPLTALTATWVMALNMIWRHILQGNMFRTSLMWWTPLMVLILTTLWASSRWTCHFWTSLFLELGSQSWENFINLYVFEPWD